MNEQLLRSIIRLYALLAGADGLLAIEKTRIEQFMSHHLSGRSVAIFLELLERSVRQVEKKREDAGWQEEELRSICAVVNKELKLAQKFYLFLEMLELSALDGNISKAEAIILDKLPQLLNLSAADVESLRTFALSKTAENFDSKGVLLILGSAGTGLSKSIVWVKEGFDGLVAVLKLDSVESYFVRFLGEKETLLNGQLMQFGMSLVWAPGATVRQEGVESIFFTDIRERFSAPTHKPPISFEANNISFRFPNGKMGLHPMSIAEKGGRIIAIMGASGSGKSTLFNVLNGNESPTSGQVVINGKDIQLHPKEVEGAIGYVHQDDLLNEHLTVYQNLYFAAKFSFGQWTEKEVVESVEKTLRSLGLFEVKDIVVGSSLQKTISGGQRKRLNIGMELIRQPFILFVDEPTSGLSSRDSMRTMELLKDLALNGKLVFVIIHQPSADIFKMFDKLIVLDQGGHMVYYGNTLTSVAYFKDAMNLPVNQDSSGVAPEEIFEIIEAKVVNEMGEEVEERKMTPKDWSGLFARQAQTATVETASKPLPKVFNKPGFFAQIWLYFKRDFLSKIHDRQYLFINLLEAPALALSLAFIVRYVPMQGFEKQPYVFFHNLNIPAYFFMSVIVALFMGLSISAEEILKDRLLLKREKFLHLSRDSYLIAKILLLFGLSALHTLAFVGISDYVLEVNDIGKEYWFVMFSAACCANLMGLVLSDTFKTAITVYFLIPLLLIPQLVLGGVVIKFDKLNPVFGTPEKVPLVGETMISRWAYEAIMVAQFKNNEYQKLIFEIERKKSISHYKRTYYLNELQAIVNRLHFWPTTKPAAGEIHQQRALLLREIKKEGRLFKVPEKEWDGLKDSLPISKTAFEHATERLNDFRHRYNMAYQKADNQLSAALDTGRFRHPSFKNFHELRLASENEQVDELLLNKSFENIERLPEGFVQKVDPIYKMPEFDGGMDFRAHFYAPFKQFAGRLYPTEYFNIAVIWAMSLLTAIVLRFRLLRWLLRAGK